MARASGAAAPASPARYAPMSSTGMRPWPEGSVLAAARLMVRYSIANLHQKETAMPFYEKGEVRIRYEMVGSGFPLLVTPGGGLNSRVSNWPTAVFNAMEAFKNDFRCITMDQRNANGGESTGPIPTSDPWGAFADDQLGLMDHLGIQKFFFMGYCIGGPFGLKFIERAPDRVVAAVLCQPVGHRPENPDVMYKSGHDVWAPELRARRPEITMESIEAYLHDLYRVRPDFVYSVSREFVRSCQTPMLVMPDDTPAHPYQTSVDIGALRHAHLEGRSEPPAPHPRELRRVALAGPSDAHRVAGAAPLHHVDTFDGQDFLERVDRPRLLDHDGHDDVAQGLDVLLGAAIAHVGEPTGGHSVGSSVLWGLRTHDAHALLHVGGRATVGEQDAVEAGPDRPLREEAPRLLVDLELHRHAVDVRGSSEVVEVVQVEGAVLADELDVVVETRVPDGFHDGRPRGVNVGGQRGLVGLQELAQLVGSHVVSPIVF